MWFVTGNNASVGFGFPTLNCKLILCFNDEMTYEMDHVWTADVKSSKAMILAVKNAIFAIE